MAANESARVGAWSTEDIITLVINIIKQGNPDLTISGWKDIAERMAPLGMNENVCKKQWSKLRREFLERMGDGRGGGGDDKPAKASKRKRAAAAAAAEHDEAEDVDDTPKPRARKRTATLKKATASEAVDVDEPVEPEEDEDDGSF